MNRNKNRYCDVICNDSTRVCLRPHVSFSPGLDNECSVSQENKVVTNSKQQSNKFKTTTYNSRLHRVQSAPLSANNSLVSNYIHANWVDSYRQKNAFICTQGKHFSYLIMKMSYYSLLILFRQGIYYFFNTIKYI